MQRAALTTTRRVLRSRMETPTVLVSFVHARRAISIVWLGCIICFLVRAVPIGLILRAVDDDMCEPSPPPPAPPPGPAAPLPHVEANSRLCRDGHFQVR